MRLKSFLAVAAFSILALTASAQDAFATAVVPFTVDLGDLTSSSYGKGSVAYVPATIPGMPTSYLNSLDGNIPAQSIITITYSLGAVPAYSLLVDDAYYSDGTNTYHASADSFGGSSPASTGLLLASASFASDGAGGYIGTAIVKNLSTFAAHFTSILTSVLGAGTSALYSYEVKPVPLPAALPMFGLGLAALAGVRRKMKKSV